MTNDGYRAGDDEEMQRDSLSRLTKRERKDLHHVCAPDSRDSIWHRVPNFLFSSFFSSFYSIPDDELELWSPSSTVNSGCSFSRRRDEAAAPGRRDPVGLR